MWCLDSIELRIEPPKHTTKYPKATANSVSQNWILCCNTFLLDTAHPKINMSSQSSPRTGSTRPIVALHRRRQGSKPKGMLFPPTLQSYGSIPINHNVTNNFKFENTENSLHNRWKTRTMLSGGDGSRRPKCARCRNHGFISWLKARHQNNLSCILCGGDSYD